MVTSLLLLLSMRYKLRGVAYIRWPNFPTIPNFAIVLIFFLSFFRTRLRRANCEDDADLVN